MPTRDDQRPPKADDDERGTLVAFLDYVRSAVCAKAEGLSEQDGRVAGVPSGTTIFGLVKHLTVVETFWFRSVFAGEDVGQVDFGMDLAPGDSGPALIADYRAAIAQSNAIVAANGDLNEPAKGTPQSLRWVLVHLIEETARHAGHADILREQLDGSTGR